MWVTVKGESVIVKCEYSQKELVKAIGDYKFDKSISAWVFPLRKLVNIIDELNIQYDENTKRIYNKLIEEKQANHSKLNLANSIKSQGTELTIPGVDLTKCYLHQHKAIELAALFDSYALFMETGTGKTLVAIKLLEYWNSFKPTPAMVVAPLSTLESVWTREIRKWSNLKLVNLWENLNEFDKPYDVYLINYEQFKKLAKEGKSPIEAKIQCLIIDESSKLKNPGSQITKTVLKFRSKIPHRLCLTGTPAPNNLLEYFGQMCFINPELLGDNFFRFRNTYFFSTGFGGFLYKPKTGAKEAIIDNVSKQAFSIRKQDCLDLPDRVFETRNVFMEEIQQKAYTEMLKQNIMEFKGGVTLGVNELAKLMKLRQITSGFTITTEGAAVLISETKIKALKDLLEEIPEDKQVIVWCNFHWEIHKLQEVFKDQCCTLYGDMPQKEKERSIKEFQEGKHRILLAHPLSGGMGLTFTNCSYIIWFSLSYSQEQYSQANDRIYRIGQNNKCTYFLLLAKDTIDEVIYKVLDKKSDLLESCMELLKGVK